MAEDFGKAVSVVLVVNIIKHLPKNVNYDSRVVL